MRDERAGVGGLVRLGQGFAYVLILDAKRKRPAHRYLTDKVDEGVHLTTNDRDYWQSEQMTVFVVDDQPCEHPLTHGMGKHRDGRSL